MNFRSLIATLALLVGANSSLAGLPAGKYEIVTPVNGDVTYWSPNGGKEVYRVEVKPGKQFDFKSASISDFSLMPEKYWKHGGGRPLIKAVGDTLSVVQALEKAPGWSGIYPRDIRDELARTYPDGWTQTFVNRGERGLFMASSNPSNMGPKPFGVLVDKNTPGGDVHDNTVVAMETRVIRDPETGKFLRRESVAKYNRWPAIGKFITLRSTDGESETVIEFRVVEAHEDLLERDPSAPTICGNILLPERATVRDIKKPPPPKKIIPPTAPPKRVPGNGKPGPVPSRRGPKWHGWILTKGSYSGIKNLEYGPAEFYGTGGDIGWRLRHQTFSWLAPGADVWVSGFRNFPLSADGHVTQVDMVGFNPRLTIQPDGWWLSGGYSWTWDLPELKLDSELATLGAGIEPGWFRLETGYSCMKSQRFEHENGVRLPADYAELRVRTGAAVMSHTNHYIELGWQAWWAGFENPVWETDINPQIGGPYFRFQWPLPVGHESLLRLDVGGQYAEARSLNKAIGQRSGPDDHLMGTAVLEAQFGWKGLVPW